MAKRFGRNQKRRLREEAQTEINRFKGIALEEQKKFLRYTSEIESWARDIVHHFGSDSVFNKNLKRIRVSHVPSPYYNLGASSRIKLPNTFDNEVPFATSYEIIRALVLSLRVYDEPRDHRVYVQLESPDGKCYMAVDKQTLHDMPPRVVNELAVHIANELSQHVGKR